MTEDEKELIKKLELISRAAQINNVLFLHNIPIDRKTAAALRLTAAQLDSIMDIGLQKAIDAIRDKDEAVMDEIGHRVGKDTKDHLEFETMKTPKGGGH